MDINQINIYSAISTIIVIYSIIVTYVVYLFREDFEKVFCKKKEANRGNENIPNILKEKST